MKLLFTEGVGATQTTTNAQDEKIKIFASESDMLDNIDTLEDNEIVATNDATEADLIGNMLTEIAALKEKLNGLTPKLIDFNTYSETSVVTSNETVLVFTAQEDCFFAISQQWSGEAEIGCWVYIFDENNNILVENGYAGYGTSNIPSVMSGFVFVPKGKSIKYMFKGYGGSLRNPKTIVRTK